MYYGYYKNVRDSAWECLLEFGIDSLPVDVLKITRKVGISVVKNSDVNDLMPGEDGKSYFNGHRWIIIYNDKNPTAVSRFTIAHELGHFFLGHDMTHTRYEHIQKFGTKPHTEQEADMFALRLLAPACVLAALEARKTADIAKYCIIPSSFAKARADRMKTIFKKDKFFTNPLEKQVYENFRPYLKKATKAKKKLENL